MDQAIQKHGDKINLAFFVRLPILILPDHPINLGGEKGSNIMF